VGGRVAERRRWRQLLHPRHRSRDDHVFAFGRRAGGSQVIVVINNSAQPANVDLQSPAWAVATARYEEVLRDGASALSFAGRRVPLTVPARSSAVYVRR
jgi:hypothetical protein